MLKNPAIRRPLALLLGIVGALVMFLAPETWAGLALLAAGVSLELIGIALRHRGPPRMHKP
jgi:hypothetical protein